MKEMKSCIIIEIEKKNMALTHNWLQSSNLFRSSIYRNFEIALVFIRTKSRSLRLVKLASINQPNLSVIRQTHVKLLKSIKICGEHMPLCQSATLQSGFCLTLSPPLPWKPFTWEESHPFCNDQQLLKNKFLLTGPMLLTYLSFIF